MFVLSGTKLAQIVYIFVTGDDTVTRLMYPGYCLSHTQSYHPPPPPPQQEDYLDFLKTIIDTTLSSQLLG